jgi:hypothetical protein
VRRFGAIYGYDVRDHHTGAVHPRDYVGQSRVPELRDRQHRGLAPQRDGQVREQPWADRIVGGQQILASGMFTDDELDAEEIRLIHALRPRLNCRDNPNPNRIPIYVQHEQRKLRDPNWVMPDWSRPRRSVRTVARNPLAALWRWLLATLPFRVACLWVVLALLIAVGVGWGFAELGQPLPLWWAAGLGGVGAVAPIVKWWKTIRRWLRRR